MCSKKRIFLVTIFIGISLVDGRVIKADNGDEVEQNVTENLPVEPRSIIFGHNDEDELYHHHKKFSVHEAKPNSQPHIQIVELDNPYQQIYVHKVKPTLSSNGPVIHPHLVQKCFVTSYRRRRSLKRKSNNHKGGLRAPVDDDNDDEEYEDEELEDNPYDEYESEIIEGNTGNDYVRHKKKKRKHREPEIDCIIVYKHNHIHQSMKKKGSSISQIASAAQSGNWVDVLKDIVNFTGLFKQSRQGPNTAL